MLAELFIQNFAIIDELRLQLDGGFNVLTGETGAGKSIILDAVMLILGERADSAMVRADCDAAYIEATFALPPSIQGMISPLLEEGGLRGEYEDELIIGRELRQNGRTKARINGRNVSTHQLQEIGQLLVDIHGQGSHLGLLQSKSHLPILDRYANVIAEQGVVAQAVSELRRWQKELRELQQSEADKARRIDLLSYQLNEIEGARIQLGEEEALLAERKRLSNVEQLQRFSAESYALLDGDGTELPTALMLLTQAENALTQLARLDETQSGLLEQLQSAIYQLNDVTSELQRYGEILEYDPERLAEVEERLELLAQLKRKYGGDLAAVLAFGVACREELTRFEQSDERAQALQKQIAAELVQIGRLSAELSGKRQSAAQTLAQSIERELHELKMNARFAVDFQHHESADGVPVGEHLFAFDQTGIDKVEFLISANPGEPLKPMAKVASGGETARLMLALKTALAQVDSTPTLIFDEIDQGIGGRIGDIVGRKLWQLSGHSGHQVIVVTHLPQLAGYGDKHYHVRKQIANGRTATELRDLTRQERIAEIAQMIGTDEQSSLSGATVILQEAERTKAGLQMNQR